MKRIFCWTLLTAIALSTGCSSLSKDWKKKVPWWPEARIKSSKYEAPSQLIAIWSSDVITEAQKPPTRGFGGRIYFYNDKNQTIPVEGQLVVYGYDDRPDLHEPGKPQRKFAFTPDQFTKHFSESDLGASYSVWIPWDAVGGEQKNISLVPVFTATSGQIVMGQQAITVLPGPVAARSDNQPKSALAAGSAPTGIQQVTHEQSPGAGNASSAIPADATGPSTPSAQRLRTSTISLTRNLQRRIALSPEMTAATAMANRPPTDGTIQFTQQSTVPPTAPAAQPTAPAAVPQGAVSNAIETDRLSAASPVAPRLGPPSAHSVRQRFPARGALNAQSGSPVPQTPPYPAGLPSAPQPAWQLPAPPPSPASW